MCVCLQTDRGASRRSRHRENGRDGRGDDRLSRNRDRDRERDADKDRDRDGPTERRSYRSDRDREKESDGERPSRNESPERVRPLVNSKLPSHLLNRFLIFTEPRASSSLRYPNTTSDAKPRINRKAPSASICPTGCSDTNRAQRKSNGTAWVGSRSKE